MQQTQRDQTAAGRQTFMRWHAGWSNEMTLRDLSSPHAAQLYSEMMLLTTTHNVTIYAYRSCGDKSDTWQTWPLDESESLAHFQHQGQQTSHTEIRLFYLWARGTTSSVYSSTMLKNSRSILTRSSGRIQWLHLPFPHLNCVQWRWWTARWMHESTQSQILDALIERWCWLCSRSNQSSLISIIKCYVAQIYIISTFFNRKHFKIARYVKQRWQ